MSALRKQGLYERSVVTAALEVVLPAFAAELRVDLAAVEDAALRNAEMLHSVMKGDRTLDLIAERDEARDLVRRMVAGQLLPMADYPWLDEEQP